MTNERPNSAFCRQGCAYASFHVKPTCRQLLDMKAKFGRMAYS